MNKMTTAAQAHGSGFNPVFVKESDGGHDRHAYGFMYMWAFLIFIVFVIIAFAFFRKRDDGIGVNAIAPLVAAKAMSGAGECGPCYRGYDDYKMWDHSRDDLKEQGYIKMEMKDNMWKMSETVNKNHYEAGRERDRNRYDTLKEVDAVKSEIAASERRILEKIEQDRYDRVRDERDALRTEAANLRFHWKPYCADPAYAY